LEFVEEIKGFDLNNIFYNHMVAVRISPTMINTLTFCEEEGDSHDPHVQSVDKNSGNIETIVSTTKHH